MFSLPRSFRRPLSFVAMLFSPLAALAMTPPNRIAAVDSTTRVPIAHNVAGRTKAATDLGPAPADLRMDGVTLFFSRTAAQQSALAQLMVAQQTPGSPLYHQWLTPAQFGAQFGLSPADLAKVTSWLTAQGLTVTRAPASNSLVTVSGTVAQLQQAFGTSIHSLMLHGVQHVGNVTDPALPSVIANVVTGVTGLDDFRPQSHARLATPAFTSGQTGAHFLAPGDFQVIYDSKPLLSAAINGTGATIAVMGQTNLSLPDVATFRSLSGLPAQVPAVVVASTAAPTSNGGADLQESQLDIEWAGGSAPNAKLVYVTSANGVFDALQFAITRTPTTDQPTFPIISISYGSCEADSADSVLTSYSALFQQANTQGQTILASAGDVGATDCDSSPSASSVLAADGLAVDFPASSPFVTGIGGTMFNDTDANWVAAPSSTTDQVVSAIGYIPETVWNEYSSFKQIVAGGGGASLYFAKPAWQVGTGVPSDSARDVPDIALNAGAAHVGYLICSPANPGFASLQTCTNGYRDSAGFLGAVGGTSAGTPSFAGVLAQIEQKLNATSGLGNINPVLYGLGGTAAFHDITTGNNSSPCAHGAPDCQTATSIGFSAAPGYDLATGWGSVDANNLANAWAGATPTGGGVTAGAASYVTVTVPAGTQSCGLTSGSLTVTVQVASSDPRGVVPTGSVQLLVDGGAVGTPVTLSNGTATLVVATSGLSSGGHSVSALYTGSSVYAASRGYLGATLLPTASAPNTIVDVVSSTNPDFALAPCLPAVTVASGTTSAPITLAATAFNGFSGPVTFSTSTDANLAAGFTFSAPSVNVSSAAAGTATLTFSAFTTPASGNSVSGAARIPSRGTASLSPRGVLGAGAGTAALASVLFLVLPRRRRYFGVLALLISVGALGVSGCGSGAKPIDGGGTGTGPGTGTKTPTPAGTYVVNVTASGANSAGQALVHTVYVTLTVQ